MANENDPTGSRRRRPPTVIDLPATEVPSEAAPSEAAVELAPEVVSADPPPQSNDSVIPPAPMTSQPASTEEIASEPPPPPPPPQPPRAEPEPTPARKPPFAFVPEGSSWSHAGAAMAGVAGGLAVAAAFWLLGTFPGSREPSADASPRLAAIEKQVKDLTARPVPASVDPKAIDDIAARLARLEAAQAAPRVPVTDPVVLGRLNAAESATKSQADNIAALSRRAEAADAAVRETNGGIAKLTTALTDVQSTVRQAAAGSDRASRLAVAASALRNAVEHGDPFAAELAIVKPLAPDAGAIALLEPFAAAGVPGNGALGRDLAAIVRPLLRASDDAPRDGGFLDKLQANAQKLVRVRPVGDEARGDDRGAVLSRIEQRASQGNIAGVMTELAKLPPDARAPFQQWTALAEARDKAIDAARRLAAGAVAALKSAP
ncbi:MAG: hypothetical protein WCG92_01100 [Hyphomicrobiales bacterium]